MVEVPGELSNGVGAIGEVPGGARYAISEVDPLGAVVSIDNRS